MLVFGEACPNASRGLKNRGDIVTLPMGPNDLDAAGIVGAIAFMPAAGFVCAAGFVFAVVPAIACGFRHAVAIVRNDAAHAQRRNDEERGDGYGNRQNPDHCNESLVPIGRFGQPDAGNFTVTGFRRPTDRLTHGSPLFLSDSDARDIRLIGEREGLGLSTLMCTSYIEGLAMKAETSPRSGTKRHSLDVRYRPLITNHAGKALALGMAESESPANPTNDAVGMAHPIGFDRAGRMIPQHCRGDMVMSQYAGMQCSDAQAQAT